LANWRVPSGKLSGDFRIEGGRSSHTAASGTGVGAPASAVSMRIAAQRRD